MTQVLKTPFPRDSQLAQLKRPGDFLDGYAVTSALPLDEALQRALSMPGWATALLALRNKLVKPLGLKTETEGADAIFPETYRSADERIIGTDDRHLNFRIGLCRRGAQLHMGTWVHPHHIGGRAYLAAVMPFHVVILRNAMARLAA